MVVCRAGVMTTDTAGRNLFYLKPAFNKKLSMLTNMGVSDCGGLCVASTEASIFSFFYALCLIQDKKWLPGLYLSPVWGQRSPGTHSLKCHKGPVPFGQG